MTILDTISRHKVVGIVRLDDLSIAVDLARALVAGGVRVIEFTLTNPDAVAAVEAVRHALGDEALIGAGSVISVEQVRACASAGAQFIVSPVTKADVIEACVERDLLTMPGALTPSEVQLAWELGAGIVKVFPANMMATRYIKDLLAPMPHLRLMPTGGVTTSNAKQYLDYGAFSLGVGSSLIDPVAVKNRDWAKMTETAKEFSAIVS
jgi:2-dehydro-3-deoxyphosphogluconate aldolase/(4S)-4-hydroxy-2-oxoglutarate aldolase